MSSSIMAAAPEQTGLLSRSTKEFIAGTIGGMAQVLAGQPFDIVKVRLTSSQGLGALTCTAQILKSEGPLAFWKGSLPPLLGVGACVSIQFGVVENMKRMIKAWNKGEELSLVQQMMAGSIAGVANSIVSAPAEGHRIRMQVQGKIDPRGDPHYRSSVDCMKTIFKLHGLKGSFAGLKVTVLREAGTFATYFGMYEYMVSVLKPAAGTVEDLSVWQLLLAGGMAGYAYWLPWYPIDAIKSKLQADSLANPRYKGILDCLAQTVKNEGVRGLYRGFLPCMLRAFPANATTFLTFEMTMRLLGRN